MSKTIVADHLESLLHEIEYAAKDIANCAAAPGMPPDEVERSLMQALATAKRVLETALEHAQDNGVPKLSIDAA
ncbi:hypothetical protein M2323_002140 [Rhodoblastus acidophilus]|uniref:hypothetical protein n=1 Tax=Rhodoblastus acidophilus TaxID=1074 RepID=UPI00222436F5|nr:hypothetical protein [Rhodoblastus acidophilus]MCW2284311.1 hypothetical protein [Rhodoblastus acidophilus]MCW2333211.1 hypothetical protein [Rhodoblastus acidophilus]